MNIRVFNQKVLEPGSQLLMILGIIFLCQPWVEFLHQYSVTIIIVGLLTFMFTGWFGGEKAVVVPDDDNDGVFDVSDHRDGRGGRA